MAKKQVFYPIIRIFIPLLALGTGIALGTRKQKTVRTSHTAQTQYETLLADLRRKEDALWDTLTTTTGVTKQHCEQNRTTWAQSFKAGIEQTQATRLQKFGPVSERTQATIRSILQQAGLANYDIKIIPFKGNGSPAATDDFTVYVDEKELSRYSPEGQKAILAHEIMHIKHRDCSLFTELFNLVEKSSQGTKLAKQIFKLHELWADLDALQLGPAFTKGCITSLHTFKSRFGDVTSATHPAPSERLAVAQQMHNAFTQMA